MRFQDIVTRHKPGTSTIFKNADIPGVFEFTATGLLQYRDDSRAIRPARLTSNDFLVTNWEIITSGHVPAEVPASKRRSIIDSMHQPTKVGSTS